MNSLPISFFSSNIITAVNDNPVVIITAETGAGKSTQVPQYLLREGYNVVVTQPRRLAARTVAQRVAEEYGCTFGDVIGFRTAYERCDSDQTRCLFVTDGLALVRELMGFGRHNVLVLDEVHEWNLNMEVLVAWAKRQLSASMDFKVVVMSATLEAGKLAEFFGGAPVINVPGRLFPVQEEKPNYNIVSDAEKLLRAGRNVLVFQPGKAEIAETISQLKDMQDLSAEILPLHGELSVEEQAACFRHYARPKCIVSTNVAQTSITIDDIDAVVDSGMERRVELMDGVEGLYLKPISYADAAQRKGRAGRTKAGIYIDHCRSSDRLEFPKAEILRVRLDQAVLRLAEAGIDVENLEFFHQPDKAEIKEAKRALKALGCMDNTGLVTEIGHRIAKLPISVQFGRMIIEAEQRGVVDDIIDIAALLEQGEITIRKTKDGRLGRTLWRELCPDEKDSDIMAQLAVFRAAESMSKSEMVEKGVFIKAFYQAKEKRRHLAQALKGKVKKSSTAGNKREDIIFSICAGMVDHLFRCNYGDYINGDSQKRSLSQGSVVQSAEWLIGIPFDLEIKTKRECFITLNLITMATKVDPMWLTQLAPQLVQVEEGIDPFFNEEQDTCYSTTKFYFNGQMVKEEQVATPDHEQAAEVFVRWLSGKLTDRSVANFGLAEELNKSIERNIFIQNQARKLNLQAGKDIFPIMSLDDRVSWLRQRLKGAPRRLSEIANFESLQLPELDQGFIEMVLADNPDTIEVLGRTVPVEYSDCAPCIHIDFRGDDLKKIVCLPDEGVFLPGGREVAIYSAIEGLPYYIKAKSSQFKRKVYKDLNEKLWENWQSPEIPIPDLTTEDAVIPEIIIRKYGKCAVSGVSLLAYGSVVAYRYWSNDPITWKYEWYRERAEAERKRAEAKELFAEFWAEAERKRKIRQAQSVAQDIKERIGKLYYADDKELLQKDLRNQLYEHHHGWIPSGLEDILEWIAKAEAICTKVEVAYENMRRKRAEEQKKQQEEQQIGSFGRLLAKAMKKRR